MRDKPTPPQRQRNDRDSQPMSNDPRAEDMESPACDRPTEPPRPPVSPASGVQTPPEDHRSELGQIQRRSVRLVISIPVLTLLIALSSGGVLYVFLQNLADLPGLSEETRNLMERGAVAGLLISILISLVAGALGYVIARQIVGPIKNLVVRMDELAEGNLTTRLQPLTLGEFGQLGSTFNRMVDQLNRLFEERDRQLRESFQGAHMLLSPDGTILQADQSVRRIFGQAHDELLGRNILAVDSGIPLMQRNPRLLDALADMLHRAASGNTVQRSVPIRGEAGETAMRCFLSATALDNKEEGGSNVLVEMRDITAIASFHEQMQRADRLAAVGTLATGIAHEIRNPLASIRGMAQLLEETGIAPGEEMPAEMRQDFTRRIIREVDRLEKLVAGIMNFAQTADAPVESININDLLRELADAARQTCEGAAGIPVTFDLEPSLPEVTLQSGRLRQAVLNLLVNAFQHASAVGRGPIRIETMYLAVNPQRPLIICIANPGDPIDEATRERMFEPFFTTKPEGTGLGLPIAHQAILSNGGILEMECGDGEIQFWIRLPREAPTPRSSSRLVPRMETPMPLTRD